jgi:hypothetical protein
MPTPERTGDQDQILSVIDLHAPWTTALSDLADHVDAYNDQQYGPSAAFVCRRR